MEATDLPVSADLEKGFGDAPEVGGGDHPPRGGGGAGGRLDRGRDGRSERPLFDIGQATERVAAAVVAARALPFPFTLDRARGELPARNPDLDDTIGRLQAFEEAGADVLFAPGLPDLAACARSARRCRSRSTSWSASGASRSRWPSSTAAGVKRISLATSLYRAAMNGLLEAAREVKDRGTFAYLDRRSPRRT